MGKCVVCKTHTFLEKGCQDNLYFKKQNDYIDRKKNEADENCYICNCPPGSYHHAGCENEKCPVCSEEIFDCECTEKTLFQVYNL